MLSVLDLPRRISHAMMAENFDSDKFDSDKRGVGLLHRYAKPGLAQSLRSVLKIGRGYLNDLEYGSGGPPSGAGTRTARRQCFAR